MAYRIAGIDVHKKILAVVVCDIEVEGEYRFEPRKFSSSPEQLRSLATWLLEQEAEEVVMESTAQYWKPVWEALERYWTACRNARRSEAQIGDTASSTGVVQSRTARAQERLS
jgi:Transposase